MIWILLGAVAGLFCLTVYVLWRKWGAPWERIEHLVRQVAEGNRPRTFVVGGNQIPARVALMLENIADRRQQLDHQLAERAAGTQTIFAAMQDGLMVVDVHRRISMVNRTFRELFGLNDNLSGTPLLEVVRNVELDRLVAGTLRTGLAQRGELTIPDPTNNSVRQMQLSAVVTRNETEAPTGVVVLFHDITQLKQADEIRRDFVANVSHELRTPLSILRGYIETLLDDPGTSSEELVRMLEVMKRHSNRLGTLVDDLLTLAQLESADPKMQFSDVRLSELFAGIVRDWGKKFAEKKLSIDVALDPNLPAIRADETRLQEVLYNLLDNALKVLTARRKNPAPGTTSRRRGDRECERQRNRHRRSGFAADLRKILSCR